MPPERWLPGASQLRAQASDCMQQGPIQAANRRTRVPRTEALSACVLPTFALNARPCCRGARVVASIATPIVLLFCLGAGSGWPTGVRLV